MDRQAIEASKAKRHTPRHLIHYGLLLVLALMMPDKTAHAAGSVPATTTQYSCGGTNYATAVEAEMCFYTAWSNKYGTTACGFNSLTWVELPTVLHGYIPCSASCGCGHVLPVGLAKIAGCPAHSTNTGGGSCTCDTGYAPDAAGTSCVNEQYSITLTPAAPTTEPSSLLPFNAVVKDQNGVVQPGKQVTIKAEVQGGTGGHIHTDNRPKGNFTCSSALGSSPASCTLTTDASGQAPFEFVATPISGKHTITATCDGCSNTETRSVDVMVSGLIPIPASSRYALQDSAGTMIGAIPGKHTANHYLTSASIKKLNDFAQEYQIINPGAKLYLNDASLVWGGLFDVGSTPWSSPHNGHDRGLSVDIRAANSGVNNEGAVPATAFADASKSAAKAHAKAALHCSDNGVLRIGAPCNGIPNNRHFHVDF